MLSRRSPKAPRLLLICATKLIILVVINLVYAQGLALDSGFTIYFLCVLGLVDFSLSVFSWIMLTGTVFNLYGLFLISSYLFNCGQLFLEVFHLNANGILEGNFPPSTILATVCLVSVCQGTLHLGAMLGLVAPQTSGLKAYSRRCLPGEIDLAARVVGWFLLAVSIVPMILTMAEALSVA